MSFVSAGNKVVSGDFHRQCVTKEFNIYGIYNKDKEKPMSWVVII